jgi:hypothetical protein
MLTSPASGGHRAGANAAGAGTTPQNPAGHQNIDNVRPGAIRILRLQ